MKYAIGELVSMPPDGDFLVMIGDTDWPITNFEEIPEECRADGQALLFKYCYHDQFRTYVPIEKVEAAFDALCQMTADALTLSENDEAEGPRLQFAWDSLSESIEKARKVLVSERKDDA